MAKSTYDKILDWDKKEVFNQIDILKLWIKENKLDPKTLHKIWIDLDILTDMVYWKMKDEDK